MKKCLFLGIAVIFFVACGSSKSVSITPSATNSDNGKAASASNSVSTVNPKNNTLNQDSISKTEQDTDKNKRPKMYPLKLNPKYPGGIDSAIQFIQTHIQYPAEALKNNISGTVFVDFRIMRDGSVSDVTIRHGLGYGCDEEAIRVIKLLKGWDIGGRESVPYGLPVKFELPAK